MLPSTPFEYYENKLSTHQEHMVKKMLHTVYISAKNVVMHSISHRFFMRCLSFLLPPKTFLSYIFISSNFSCVVIRAIYAKPQINNRRTKCLQRERKHKTMRQEKMWKNYETCHEIHKYLVTSVPLSLFSA